MLPYPVENKTIKVFKILTNLSMIVDEYENETNPAQKRLNCCSMLSSLFTAC